MTETDPIESGVVLVTRHLKAKGELKRREVRHLLGQKRRAAGVEEAVVARVVESGQAVKVAAPHGSWRLALSRADDALAAMTDDEAATTEQRRAAGAGPFRRVGDTEGVVRELVRVLVGEGGTTPAQRRAARAAVTRLEELGAR